MAALLNCISTGGLKKRVFCEYVHSTLTCLIIARWDLVMASDCTREDSTVVSVNYDLLI